MHNKKVIHKQLNRPFLHTESVKKSEEYRPFLIAMEWLELLES